MDYRIIIILSMGLFGLALFALIIWAANDLSKQKLTKIKQPWQK